MHLRKYCVMTLVEALLSLPRQGEPKAVDQKVGVVLTGASARFVRRHSKLWSLTEGGRQFLAQFCGSPIVLINRVVVRLVVENDTKLFDLLCDEDLRLRVRRADLERSLERIRTANPHVRVSYDFRSHGRVS